MKSPFAALMHYTALRHFKPYCSATALLGLALLSGCSASIKPPLVVAHPPIIQAIPPGTAASSSTLAALTPTALAAKPGWAAADMSRALAAFRKSCPGLQRRADLSGLTRPGDWAAACAAAERATDARAFFHTAFTGVVIGTGAGLNTGYFEPEIAGSRVADPRYPVPFYRRPADLIDVDLGLFSAMLTGKKVRGRVEGRALIPYVDRAAIDQGALAGTGLELAWAADRYEAFFLEIQGSGRLRLADGSVMRIGFDGQNGRDYVAIGKILRERAVLAPGQATMDGILTWMRANPDAATKLMQTNKSYIFFREVTPLDPDDGPSGAMGVALTPETSVAVDPVFIPLGAPLWLDTQIAPEMQISGRFTRMMVAQDTGGAIKGLNRLDIFWGTGERARRLAGGLSATGRMILLLPPEAVRRLLSPAGAPN